MLFLVIISIISSILTRKCVNGSIFDIGDWLEDRVDDVKDIPDIIPTIPGDELMNVINSIPNLPILGEYAKIAQCAIEAGKAVLNPTSTAINDVTITIQNRITKIKECSTEIIDSVKKIVEDNNKNAYLDLAKGVFTKCTDLNAGVITIEYGVSVAGLVGVSGSIGLAIETSTGKVFSYIAGCLGIQSDITIDGGYTLSLFDGGINDVAGCSKYYAVGFDVNVMGVEVASMDKMAIYNLPSERIIARGIGYGVGVGGNPYSVENGYCYTFDPIYMVNMHELINKASQASLSLSVNSNAVNYCNEAEKLRIPNGATYLCLDRNLRHIPDETTYYSLFANIEDDVIHISDTDLNSYFRGNPLISGLLLFKSGNSDKVYLKDYGNSGGVKRWIVNIDVFYWYHFDESKIKTYTDKYVNQWVEGLPITE